MHYILPVTRGHSRVFETKFSQQELGPWCAAAALSAVLQPSVRNMYTSGESRQQGADALGLPDAPPMGLADAWSAAAPILCMGYLELQIMCIECPQC